MFSYMLSLLSPRGTIPIRMKERQMFRFRWAKDTVTKVGSNSGCDHSALHSMSFILDNHIPPLKGLLEIKCINT